MIWIAAAFAADWEAVEAKALEGDAAAIEQLVSSDDKGARGGLELVAKAKPDLVVAAAGDDADKRARAAVALRSARVQLKEEQLLQIAVPPGHDEHSKYIGLIERQDPMVQLSVARTLAELDPHAALVLLARNAKYDADAVDEGWAAAAKSPLIGKAAEAVRADASTFKANFGPDAGDALAAVKKLARYETKVTRDPALLCDVLVVSLVQLSTFRTAVSGKVWATGPGIFAKMATEPCPAAASKPPERLYSLTNSIPRPDVDAALKQAGFTVP